MPQSSSKWAACDLTKFSQSSSPTLLYFPESHQWPEISSLLKGILVLGKARSHRALNLGCKGLSHLGDLMFGNNTARDVMHEQAHCCDEAVNHQLSTVVAF